MTTITLYKYERDDGGMTVSPVMPSGREYAVMYRLVADDGMVLVNGDEETVCVDTDDASAWTEKPSPEELTDSDALRIITGGVTDGT